MFYFRQIFREREVFFIEAGNKAAKILTILTGLGEHDSLESQETQNKGKSTAILWCVSMVFHPVFPRKNRDKVGDLKQSPPAV